jgi:hypothetical protein
MFAPSQAGVVVKLMTLAEKQDLIRAFDSGNLDITSLSRMYGLPRQTVDDIINVQATSIRRVHPLVAGKSVNQCCSFSYFP